MANRDTVRKKQETGKEEDMMKPDKVIIKDVEITKPGKYDLVIAGASLAGIGAALANMQKGKSVVIIERTSLIGGEFIDAIRHGDPGGYSIKRPECLELKQDAVRRNLVSETGRLHLPPFAPLLFSIIRRTGIRILFMTDITGVSREDGHFRIDIYNVSGFDSLEADEVIDTTAEFVTNMKYKSDIRSKSLNCYVTGGELLHEDVFRDGVSAGADRTRFKGDAFKSDGPINRKVVFERGRFSNETVMKFPLEPGDGWAEARAKLAAFMTDRPESLREVKVICAANTFEMKTGSVFYEVLKASDECRGWYRLVSGAYDNLFEAYDKGLEMALREDVRREAAIK